MFYLFFFTSCLESIAFETYLKMRINDRKRWNAKRIRKTNAKYLLRFWILSEGFAYILLHIIVQFASLASKSRKMSWAIKEITSRRISISFSSSIFAVTVNHENSIQKTHNEIRCYNRSFGYHRSLGSNRCTCWWCLKNGWFIKVPLNAIRKKSIFTSESTPTFIRFYDGK